MEQFSPMKNSIRSRKLFAVTVVAIVLSASTACANARLEQLHGLMDTNEDQLVSEAEFMGLWAKNFNTQDKNQDQQLTVDECGQAAMAADTNKDKVVTIAEVTTMRMGHFKSMDKDRDQFLTLPEMLRTAATGTVSAKTPARTATVVVEATPENARLQKLHEAMDTNEDASVTQAEFLTYWEQNYHKRKNARVTLEEDQTMRKGHHKSLDKDQNGLVTLPEMLGVAAKPASSPAAVVREQRDLAADRAAVDALSNLTAAPAMRQAEGFESTDHLAAIYYDALDWQGKPTKVFAWLGLPEERSGKVPAVVLVHGGGGTAFKEWVKLWNDRGYAAISIAVEGQTDRANAQGSRDSKWFQHEWAGPQRSGIYHDSQKPLKEQWMYHAVADTILANSLLRSLPEVDAEQVGLMGISWGGVITSTVIGLDDRFAFAIPTYGCGGLATAANQYGQSLENNETYRQVWDPILRLQHAHMPTLWLSWPEDAHFPMDCLADSYGQVSGKHMLSLVPKMGHGHGSGWNRPESYAFADSVTQLGAIWCRQLESSQQGQVFSVSFESNQPLEAAELVSTVDSGFTGRRMWVQTPIARPSQNGTTWTVQAEVPQGSTAWFINVMSDGIVASSDYVERD